MTSPERKQEPVPTVLLVHGDSGVAERLQLVLSGGGFEVSAAGDGDEAVARLRRINPDVVLIDLGLALTDARQFTAMLGDGSLGRRVPFITLSDGPPAQAGRSALEIGAEECLSRPFSPPDLLLRVRRTLERLEENRSLARSNAELNGTVRRVRATQEATARHLHDRVAGIRSIVEFSQTVDPGLDRDEARLLAIRHVSATLEAPGVALFERSGPDSAWLVPVARIGVQESRVHHLRVPAAGEFLRILAAAGHPLGLDEFERIPGTSWEVGVLTAAGFTLAAPLLLRREPAGLLVLSERSGGRPYAPADLDLLSLTAASLAHLFEVGRARAEERRRAILTLGQVVDRLEAAHPFLTGHSQRVARLAGDVARSCGVSGREIEELVVAAWLHDIGCSFLPREMLDQPGPLSPAQWEAMRRHPALGARVAQDAGWPEPVLAAIRHHHEAWSGSGYPDGRKGEEIPLGARILAVAEAFDALSSPRPYRGPLAPAEIAEIFLSESGTRFDPRCVEILLQLVRGEELRPAG